MPNTIDYILKYGFHKNYDKDFNDNAHEAQQRLRSAVIEFDAKRTAINADASLSIVGKAEAKAKLAEEMLKRVDEVEKHHLAKERHSFKEFKARVFPSTRPSDAVRAIQEREVRDHLAQLDASSRMETFRKAIDSGDELVYSAIMNAPATLSLLNPSLVEEGRLMWLERQDEVAGDTGELRATQYRNGIEVIEQLTGDIEDVRQIIMPETSLRERLEAQSAA